MFVIEISAWWDFSDINEWSADAVAHKTLAAAQVLEKMVQRVASVLNPVCGPIEVPLVVLLPRSREIPYMLCSVPVANPVGRVLRSHARALHRSEIRRRIDWQRVPVAVLPLSVFDQTGPIRSGDFLFRTRPLP